VRAFEPAEWRDGIVVIERGAVELEAGDGDRARFARGAVIALAALPVRGLRNDGREIAVIAIVRRRSGE
jgi:L-asparaginase II